MPVIAHIPPSDEEEGEEEHIHFPILTPTFAMLHLVLAWDDKTSQKVPYSFHLDWRNSQSTLKQLLSLSDVNRDTVFTRASYAPELSPSSAAGWGHTCVLPGSSVCCGVSRRMRHPPPLLFSSSLPPTGIVFSPPFVSFPCGRTEEGEGPAPSSFPSVPCPPPSDPKLPICCCLTSHILICMGPSIPRRR